MSETPEVPKSLITEHKLPITWSLPDYLKDPKNYKKVMKAIVEAGNTPHSHGDLLDWSTCLKCQRAQHNRADTMRKLGFRSGAQYFAWRKTMETYFSLYRDKLEKYNS